MKWWNDMDDEEKRVTKTSLLIAGVVVASVPLWFANVTTDPVGTAVLTQPSSWNEAGDSFGVLTSVFTALAFVLMWHSMMLQRIELKAQREELKDAREAQEHQAKIQLISLRHAVMASRIESEKATLDAFNAQISTIEHALSLQKTDEVMNQFQIQFERKAAFSRLLGVSPTTDESLGSLDDIPIDDLLRSRFTTIIERISTQADEISNLHSEIDSIWAELGLPAFHRTDHRSKAD